MTGGTVATAFRFLFSAILTRSTDSSTAGPVTGIGASRNRDFGIQGSVTGVGSLEVPAARARDRVGSRIDWETKSWRLRAPRYSPVVVDRHRLILWGVGCITGIRRVKGEILTHRVRSGSGARRGRGTSEALFEASGYEQKALGRGKGPRLSPALASGILHSPGGFFQVLSSDESSWKNDGQNV